MLLDNNAFQDGFGNLIVQVHPHTEDCDRYGCVIHAPSDHPMVDWPLLWRADRQLMERICPEHGTGHPDPDDMAFKFRTMGDAARYEGMHGCCGCCQPDFDGQSPSKGVEVSLMELKLQPNVQLQNYVSSLGGLAEQTGQWMALRGTFTWHELQQLRTQLEPLMLGEAAFTGQIQYYSIAKADQTWGTAA